MNSIVPVVPALDERCYRVVVARVLQVQHLAKQFAHDVVVTLVVDGQQRRVAARFDEPVLHEKVELHQLHVLVRLFGPRSHNLQRTPDAVGIMRAQTRFIVVADLQ